MCSVVPEEGKTTMAAMATLGLDELSMFKMMQNQPQAASFLPTLNRLRVGSRDLINYKFQFAPMISMQETLIDNHVSTDGPIVSWSSLPNDVNQALDARVARLKKSPFGDALAAGFGAGKGVIKP